MAMTVTKVDVTAEVRAFVYNDVDLARQDPAAEVLGQMFKSFLVGTGLDQCNQVYSKAATITAAGRNTYDLAGSLTDMFGNTITFTGIKGLYVKNTSTTAARLLVGGGSDGAGTNAWDTWVTSTAADGSEGVIVPKGGALLLVNPVAAGFGVTAGTVDILAIEELDTLVGAYDLMVFGNV